MSLCPINGCTRRTQEPELLCKPHWFDVPVWLRKRIWMLFKNAPGSDEHRAACFQAIEAVNALQAPAQGRLDL